MKRSPDPARSRAVLIGASHYRSLALREIPAVYANLVDLKAALVDTPTGTLAAENCEIVSDPAAGADIGSAIMAAADAATDLLLVYYAGHGLLDESGRLHLALSTSDPDSVRWTALPFEVIREEMARGPARARVLILDCCFSGRAIEAMSDMTAVITGQVDIAGTYTLTSTTANALSHAPVGATHTAFTGAVLAVVRSIPDPLPLDELFRQLDHYLATRGLPRPQRRTVNMAGDLTLFQGAGVTASPETERLLEKDPDKRPMITQALTLSDSRDQLTGGTAVFLPSENDKIVKMTKMRSLADLKQWRSLTEATVTCWLKRVGDRVAASEPLLEISADKYKFVMPSPVGGVLLAINVREGEIFDLHAQLAVISAPSSTWPKLKNTKAWAWLVSTLLALGIGWACVYGVLYNRYAGGVQAGGCIYSEKRQDGSWSAYDTKMQPCSEPWRKDGAGYKVLARTNGDPRVQSLTDFCAEHPDWIDAPGTARWLPPKEANTDEWTGLCLQPLD